MKISVIIPTLNESQNIGHLVDYLITKGGGGLAEVIVCDGGSDDDTITKAEEAGAQVVTSDRSRSIQMNAGAAYASGQILYFVHADSFPPATFVSDITQEIRKGNLAGCFRFRFDSNRWLLKVNAYFTRFSWLWCRGGDQTLFIERSVFQEMNGFNEQLKIMEEYEFIRRIKKQYGFRIIPKNVTVSARKYESNNYLKVNFANFLIFQMYRLGYSQDRMIRTYYKLLGMSTYRPT